MRYLISAAVLGMTLGSWPAFAQDNQPKVGQKFGDWVFQCSAVAQNQTDCAFVQTIVTPDGKRQVAQLQMLEQRTAPGTYILTVVLPLGLDIQNGVTARVDQAEPVPATLKTCLPRGCIASMPLDEASAKRYARKSAFLEFCEKDGLSVLTGFGIDDLKTAPLKHWERLGGPAAYCHLEGSQGFVGVFIAEISPGK